MKPEVLSDEQKVFLWIRENRGVCSQVASTCEVSHTFVRKVLYGQSKSSEFRVEKALLDAGALFMRDRIEAA